MEKGDCGEKQASTLPCGSTENENTKCHPLLWVGSTQVFLQAEV